VNAVSKKSYPQFIRRFKDFERAESYGDVGNKIVKFAEEFELEVDADDVELLDAHGDELTNEQLMELEAARAKEREVAEAEDQPAEDQRRFMTKETVTAFREISSAVARFEKTDSNSLLFLEVQGGLMKHWHVMKRSMQNIGRPLFCHLLISLQGRLEGLHLPYILSRPPHSLPRLP
jgi:DNA-directed RNA polymerase subunit K/omega